MDFTEEIIKLVDCCIIPKLPKNHDEGNENPTEYVTHERHLEEHFQRIIDLIKNIKRNQIESSPFLLASLFILYHELRSSGSWNTEKSKQYSDKLSSTFNNTYGVSLDCILQNNKFNTQEVFDTMILDLHMRISSDFKKYPALVDVYYTIILEVKTYNIILKPPAVLPISLLLIDDYINANKVKGLKCCISILQCLDQKDFIDGNYYEVIYRGLKKSMLVKDIEVTKLVLGCLTELFRILPSQLKGKKMNDAFATIVEQLYMESNIYRKAACLGFVKYIVQMLGVNIVNQRMFKTMLCDNIQICCNDDVAKILLADVLECLEIWLKNCWCIWRLSSDHKLLSALFTLLCVCKMENHVPQIHYLVVTVVALCTKEEQKNIYDNLKMKLENPSQQHDQRLNLIIKDIT